MKTEANFLAVCAYLREVFDLDPAEVNLLLRDLAETLDCVRKDMLASLEAENWAEFHSVAQAFSWLAQNVGFADLQELAQAALQAAANGDKTIAEAVEKLAAISAELRGAQVAA